MTPHLRAIASALVAAALPAVVAAETQTKPATAPAAKPAATAAASPAAGKEEPVKKDSPSPTVVLKTSLGEIHIQLDAAKAPTTVANFLKYVDSKHFDGTIFHRVIPDFMIQGGGFTPDMAQKKTLDAIPLESQNGLKNKRGTVAMARTSDPNSATAQFFINVVDNPNLDYPNPDRHGYAVFGEVVKGLEVVDKIRAVKTGSKGPHQNVPLEPVLIESARRLE